MAKNQRLWTEKEVAYLEANAQVKPVTHIAHYLQRPLNSVRHKARKMKLHLETELDYFTTGYLSAELKLTASAVNKWVQKGWLKSSKAGAGRRSYITRQNLRELHASRPECFRNVDGAVLNWLLHG